jgi:dipeptidyl aminopeptidase/acylaminoacyl peptidase
VGINAVDRDGSNARQTGDNGNSSHKYTDWQFLAPTINQDSDEAFVLEPSFTGRNDVLDAVNIRRMNTRTDSVTNPLPVPRPAHTMEWFLDEKGLPRVTVTRDKDIVAVMYLDPATNAWTTLQQYHALEQANVIHPLFFTPDGSFYVTKSSSDGSGSARVYRYDLAKKATDPEPVVSIKGFDAQPRVVRGNGKVLGIRYVSDAEGTVWFDKKYKDIQAKIDRELPGMINTIAVPLRPEVPMLLVRSSSDREPGIWSLYDYEKDKLTTLGRRLPDIDPAQMGRRDFVKYKARDGLEIPAWLTLPPGTKAKPARPLPMVVLVHGGPWVRGGYWHFSPEAEFLATRGYAVLEPEFRGSTGYGFAHFKAGWKQWGLAMQDDVADGTKWAVEQGIADASRICIAGASYGGYATLMGLIKNPELYQCGFEWVGVTDIGLMYDITWSDIGDEAKQFGMPILIGDPEKDAAQLKATSPLHNAERIRQPLLLAYGGSDVRVPAEQGLKFRDAVKKTNPNVEWVEYAEEGHGWWFLKDNVDFWTRVEKFLGRHIGEGAAK